MYYTNFEITAIDFWRSKPYRDFFEHIDQSMGIYTHRYCRVLGLRATSRGLKWVPLLLVALVAV